MERPIVVAISSDHHSNSTLGLCPPSVQLQDGGNYRASTAQRQLWRWWLDFCEGAVELKETHNADLVSIFNGDLTDGDHHNTPQLISRYKAVQQRLCHTVIEKLVDHSDRVYIVRGTESHVGLLGWHEELVAQDLTNIVPGEIDSSHYELYLDFNGTLFDISHHGSIGRRPWTKMNALGRTATEIVFNYYEAGKKPPNVVIRSHMHQFVDSGSNWNSIRVIGLPAWQMKTAFVHRLGLNNPVAADIGGIYAICYPGGDYEIIVRRYHWHPGRAAKYKSPADE